MKTRFLLLFVLLLLVLSNARSVASESQVLAPNLPFVTSTPNTTLQSATAIRTSGYHTCGLTTSGSAKCWGWSSYGQLGNGSNNDSNEPVDVVGLTGGANIVTNGSWKYSYSLVADWETTSFNDSAWPNVVVPSAGPCNPSLGGYIPNSNAQPVWGQNPVQFQTIYVRKTFNVGNVFSATIQSFVDDDYDLYVNGSLVRSNHDGVISGILQDDVSSRLQPGLNSIAIKGIDVAGGCEWITADLSIESRPTAFLDLPFAYSNFSQSAQGNIGGNNTGRVNSWFDHKFPNYGKDYEITTWQGNSRPYPPGPPNNPNQYCSYGLSCYAGHNGIDFQWKPDSQTVYAAAPGTVREVNRNWPSSVGSRGSPYGNYVLIDHGNRYATFYAHLDSVNSQVGVGTIIIDPKAISLGIMGGTGGWETHLHFGVYYDTQPDGQWTDNNPNEVVDPYGWSGASADLWNVPSYYLWEFKIIDQTPVGSSGAILTSPAGNKNAIIPPGALTTTLTVRFGDVSPIAEPSAQLRSSGQSFLVQVLEWLAGNSPLTKLRTGTTGFAQPVTVTVSYGVTETLHLDVNQLAIRRWDETNSTWITLPTTVDTSQKHATGQTSEIGNFDLQAPLTCPADGAEPDDNYYGAKAIATNGVLVNDMFDILGDQDWIKFNATTGFTYLIRTSNLGVSTDTVITLYDTDGLKPLATDDNSGGGMASRLVWVAPASGTYFVETKHANPSVSGCNVTYDISVRAISPLLAPFILFGAP